MNKRELDRLLKKYKKIEPRFSIIDEQIDRSLMVSQKTLNKMIDF